MFLYLPWLKPILEIQNISKKFTINAVQQQPYLSLRDSLVNFIKTPLKGNSTSEYWALKDVSFNVMPGDTVGIIGKNGAGKSTLLKILSKITPPTSGKIICRGRIASLLEVGTGFHPELSGRENVFMNGSILGMRQTEIKKNFDAIVDFAGVEKFIDTPLKHYSSGMQLRLAFAVAAFLENEILIIDEVLAVGDAEFQKKCLGKMEDVTKTGRTVLFVSHNMGVLQSLCKKALLLKAGELSSEGKASEIINAYFQNYLAPKEIYSYDKNKTQIIDVNCFDERNSLRNEFLVNENICLKIKWNKTVEIKIFLAIELLNNKGERIFYSINLNYDNTKVIGEINSTVIIPKYLLNNGTYALHFGLDSVSPQKNYDMKLNFLHFSVIDNYEIVKELKGDFVGIDTSNFILQPKLAWQNSI